MKLPKMVKIGGHTYKVLFPYVFKERFDRWGQCDNTQLELRIGLLDSGGTEKKMSTVWVTFIHEVLHAISATTGHHIFPADENDTAAIVGFSEVMYQILVDNGWLVIADGE